MTWRGEVVECPECMSLIVTALEDEGGLCLECCDCGHEWELAPESEHP